MEAAGVGNSKWSDLRETSRASLVAETVRNRPAKRETWVPSLSWEDPWRRKRQPTPVFLPGESPWTESLADYSPWGRKELDTTERLSTTAGRKGRYVG